MNYQPPQWQNDDLTDGKVELKPLRIEDFDELYLVASDPLIWEQHPAKDRYQKEVFTRYFNDAITGNSAYLIVDKLTGKVIGSTRYYEYHPENSDISIGFTFLSRAYWGGSYNKSAKKLLLDNAFRFVDSVYFHIGTKNIRSQHAILKLGAVWFGEKAPEDEALNFEYVIEKKDWLNRIA